MGIDYLVSQHWPDIEAEYALAEGGSVIGENGRAHHVLINVSEKVPRGVRLIARGPSGHGSRPSTANPVVHLAAAVARAGTWQTPMRLNDATRAYFERIKAWRFEYPLLVALATLGMMLMISANDLMALYVGLELQSLALYVIAAFQRDSIRSTEAGVKYFVLGSVASGMLLFGASLIYGFCGGTAFVQISRALIEGRGGELGVVIGRRASEIRREEALDHVAGYSIALDMVVRGTQDRSFRKSIDSYAVLGPWLVTADEVPDPQNLDFFLAVNGEVKQKSNTSLMIMDLATQISWASSYYTLWPGDIIMSGTCSGVSQVKPGDVLHCEIDKVARCDVRILG